MLGRAKLKLLYCQSSLWRVWLRLRGANVARKVSIVGFPRVRVAAGAKLVISEGVKIFSSPLINPLVGNSCSTLWAMMPGAVLELGPDVGCSGACLCAANRIQIGEGTILGAGCMIVDNDFHLPSSTGWGWEDSPGETARPVSIGRGCFIGARAIVLKGVTIGDGAVIGAGAVVATDVPAGHLAVGNPAVSRPLPPRWLRQELTAPQ